MTPGRGLVAAVTIVAAPIVGEELILGRRGWPLISHMWWPAVEDARMRPAAATVWGTLTYHLWRPRRSWTEACTVGALSGLTLVALPRLSQWASSGFRIP